VAGSISSEMVGLWRDAFAKTVGAAGRLDVLYSGGLDSSLVAFEARESADVQLLTVGTVGSSDLLAAETGAKLLGMEWTCRTVDESDVERATVQYGEALAGSRPESLAVLVGLALALEAANCRPVLCGQGADELFLGYAHFEGLSAGAARRKRDQDLDRLLLDDWPRSIAIGRRQAKMLASPFLEPEFLAAVRRLSIEQLRAGPGRKPLLRELARARGLPAELVERPKKAFQYGSGIGRLLKSRSRRALSGTVSRR
jgi:asparagine synthase (glutamine-hydrolysing)